MLKVLFKVLFAVAGFFASINAANAGESMEIGSLTSQPIGHYDFCQKNSGKCRENPLPTHVFRGGLMALLNKVNTEVNTAVHPMEDSGIWGEKITEKWSYPIPKDGVLVGDCEDYALLKRRQLFLAGIPAQDLLLTVVRKLDGEGHAVLTITTTAGDFVLDNLTDEIKTWNKTDYHFIKRQSSQHSGQWVTIESHQNDLVSSID